MEQPVSLTDTPVFNQLPTFHELMVSAIIIGVMTVVGVFLQRILLPWLHKAAQKTSWKGDDILILSARNLVEILFLLIGFYIALFYLPFSSGWEHLFVLLFEVLFIFLATVYAGRVAKQLVQGGNQDDQERGAHQSSILSLVVGSVVYILGALIILQTLGISITPLLTALGVGGLAVALALQDTLSNLFAGLQIVAAKNIQPGHYIQLESADEGYIIDINWRSTTIRTLSNRMIIIPNNKLAASTVRNFSKPDPELSVPVEVSVSYGSDLERVERVTLDVARGVINSYPGAVKSWEPVVRFHTFGAYSINFTVVLRAQEYAFQYPMINEFVKALHQRYMAEGIEIPFPVSTVRIEKMQSHVSPST
jgi:small-conductance mechanosensitive channel